MNNEERQEYLSHHRELKQWNEQRKKSESSLEMRKINREDILNFFRNDNESCDNLNSLSSDDRYELIWHLGSHSSYLEEKFQEAIKKYENGEEDEQ